MPISLKNKILDIDLTTGKAAVNTLDPELSRKYIGGKGLGAKLLFKKTGQGMDPLSKMNPLMFVTGPLTGTQAPTSGRFCVVTKSPLTGIYLDSHCGGHFGHLIKKAGYDVISINGKAGEPVYITIKDGDIDIKPAGELWGMETTATAKSLRKKASNDMLHVAAIGPAGERLVRYAMINIDTHEQVLLGR
jgi:aldehyde:ferredoxin oxidoreductase